MEQSLKSATSSRLASPVSDSGRRCRSTAGFLTYICAVQLQIGPPQLNSMNEDGDTAYFVQIRGSNASPNNPRDTKVENMAEKEFVDYYEMLQASPNASLDTIERLFRYLAKQLHPDVAEGGDVQKFSTLIEGFEKLRDPAARAAYDAEYDRQKRAVVQLVENANCLDSDSVQRHKMLTLLYAKRRQDMRAPGIGDTTLEQLVGCPPEVMNFHLWFFKEKGWIQREESGMLSITAEGVDKIEATQQLASDSANRRLTTETKTS